MSLSTIHLEPRFITRLADILARVVGDESATVYVFGSRVRNTARATSDIDLAVWAAGGAARIVSRLREALQESTIPYTADVVDLDTADKALRDAVEKERVVVWKS